MCDIWYAIADYVIRSAEYVDGSLLVMEGCISTLIDLHSSDDLATYKVTCIIYIVNTALLIYRVIPKFYEYDCLYDLYV